MSAEKEEVNDNTLILGRNPRSYLSSLTRKPYCYNDLIKIILPIAMNAEVNDPEEIQYPPPVQGDNKVNENEGYDDVNFQFSQTTRDWLRGIRPNFREQNNNSGHKILNFKLKQGKKRKRYVSDDEESFKEFCDRHQKKSDDNFNKLFLLSLLPELQGMNKKQVNQFKRKALLLVDDILQEKSTH